MNDTLRKYSPPTAYKLVYGGMSNEGRDAIEKCFAQGISVSDIADYVCRLNGYLDALEESGLPAESVKAFFVKALEHHKFLYDVEHDKI